MVGSAFLGPLGLSSKGERMLKLLWPTLVLSVLCAWPARAQTPNESEVAPPASPTSSTSDVGASPAPAPETSGTVPASAKAPSRPPAPAPPRTRGGGPDTGGWTFGYAGYFRAPLRVGLGESGGPQFMSQENPTGLVPDMRKVDTTGDGVPNSVEQMTDAAGNPAYLPRQLELHKPVIPDDQYAHWQFTGHNKKDWAEMFFSVGNGVVSGTVAVQAFGFTDPSFKDNTAQIGIGQGWVELNHDLGLEGVSFNAKVGAHWNRYGMSGVYDSGEYDTYLIGRTHIIGGTSRIDVDLGPATVGVELGLGANEPDPHMANRARFTMLGHGHGFLKLAGHELGLHLLHAWTSEGAVPNYPARLPSYQDEEYNYEGNEFNAPNGDYGVFGPAYPNGSQTIVGIDGRFNLGLAGYLFAGYAHMFLNNSLTVSDAIESVHSFGGGEFSQGATDIYLESPYCPVSTTPSDDIAPGPNLHESCSNGTGSVGSFLVQYELGLANFGIMPGNQDLKFSLYGMANLVSVDSGELSYLSQVRNAALSTALDPSQVPTLDEMKQDGTLKLKFGGDVEYYALDFLSLGVRADHVRPHSKIPEQAFTILSPRITLRSQMVTHEEITLQYSRYFYAQRVCVGGGVVASPAADPFPMNDSPQIGLFDRPNPINGLPLRNYCTQPARGGSPQTGFGSYPSNLETGTRGATTLLPDEQVIKLEASIWW